MDNSPSLVFLTYSNRTGSTFLARLLNRYSKIGVTLEAFFPDGITSPMKSIEREEDVESYLDRLFRESHFQGWNIDRSILKQELLESGFPITFKDILYTTIKLFFHPENHEVWVFKNGLYIEYMEQVLESFPEAKFLYIYRDPRAVYYSQKSSKTSKNVPMAKNPIGMVLEYKRRVRILRNYNKPNLYSVKYEDLVFDNEKVINGVLSFLGIKNKEIEVDDYFEKIPENQKHLHGNISNKPMKARVEAWKEGLSAFEIKFIQFFLKKEMKALGYDIFEVRLSRRDIQPYMNLFLYYLKRILAVRTKKLRRLAWLK